MAPSTFTNAAPGAEFPTPFWYFSFDMLKYRFCAVLKFINANHLRAHARGVAR